MKNRSLTPVIRQALWSSIAATAGLPALAEEPPAKSAPPVTEEVTITGSRITRQSTETASPVQVLSRDAIEQSGQQNLSEILRSISAEGQGTLPTSFTAGFASGASAVSLRGLGVNATLVLLNGRRMAPYGAADDGSRVFTDLNTLPLEAVERVEVLKDGASANYGSDAIAGVVNVILRDTVEGGSVITDYGTSYASDGATARVAGTYGFGNLESDRYNVYFTAEASRQSAINSTDRSGYLSTSNLTSMGWFDGRFGAAGAGRGLFVDGNPNVETRTPYGTVQVPGGSALQRVNLTPCPEVSQLDGTDADGNPIKSNICLYDATEWSQIQPKTERYNLFAKGSYAFTDALDGYVELGYSNARTAFIGLPTFFSDNAKYCTLTASFVCPGTRITLPAGHPDNPFDVPVPVRYLAKDIGGRNGTNESILTRAVFGLRGDLSDSWRWEAGAGHIESKLDRSRTGYVLGDVLQQAINDGRYRINNPSAVSAQTYAEISPTLSDTAKTALTLADANVSGHLFELPGGKLGLAAGAEWRHETSDSPPTPFTDTGRVIGLGYAKFASDRKVAATYLEVDAPVARMLDISGALRYDHYSDFGSSTTPKLGIKFTPMQQLALRGTYSKGFRAPGPAEAGDSVTFGFTGIGVLSLGNPNLKPEESRSYTLGVVLEPLAGTSASIDYYDILRRHEINQADPALALDGVPPKGPADGQTPGAVPGSTVYYNELGNIATVSVPYNNGNRTTTRGLDLDLRQRFGLGTLGGIDLSLSWTRVLEFSRLLDDEDHTKIDYVGTGGPFVLSSATGSPRDRGNLSATWSRAAWSVTGRFSYVGSMQLIDHKGEKLIDVGDGTFVTDAGDSGPYFVQGGVDGAPACGVYTPAGLPYHGCRSGSFTTFDLFGKASIGEHLEITGSIMNVTNRMAPFNPYTYGGFNYNPAWAQSGAIGRYITIGGRYQF